MRARALLLTLLVAAVGCASTGDVRSLRGDGVTRYYEAPLASVWRAALDAVEANGLRLDEESRDEGYIVATHLPSRRPDMAPEESMAVSADQGERVGIFVERAGPGVVSVEVVNRKRFALDPSSTDWTEDVFWVVEKRLGPDARLDGPIPEATDSTRSDTAVGSRPGGG